MIKGLEIPETLEKGTVESSADKMVAFAREFKVVDKETHEVALQFIAKTYDVKKAAEKYHRPDIKNAHTTWQGLTKKLKAITDAADEAKKLMERPALAYSEAERKKAEVAQAEERERLRKKAEEEQIERAAVHEEMGMPGLAEEILEEPLAPAEPEAPQTVATSKRVAVRGRWKASLSGDTDTQRRASLILMVKHLDKNPDMLDLIKVDGAALNRLAQALKKGLKIPGVRVWEDKSIQGGR